MALIDQLTAITQELILPKLVDNVKTSNVILERLFKKGTKHGAALHIQQPLEYAFGTGGWYSGYDKLDTTPSEEITAAAYDWRQGYGVMQISRTDELKNAGKRGVVKLLNAKRKNAEKGLRDRMGTALFGVGGSKDIDGFRTLVSDSATVGGIAVADASWWVSKTVSDTVLTLPSLNDLFVECTEESEHPTIGVTTKANFKRIWNQIQPAQRLVDSKMANAGFSNVSTIEFNGAPIVVDSHCPANYFFWLNENYLDLVTHEDENFRFDPWRKPTDQEAALAKVFWAGNITTSNRRMHGFCSGYAG
jgi:hypothetical protein